MTIKIPLTSLVDSIDSSIDLFINCASFESRCLSTSLVLAEQQIASVVIFFIDEPSNSSIDNRSELSKLFNGNYQEVPLPHDNPRVTADNIIEAISPNFQNFKNILVDISTFTRESLLILIKALEQHKQSHQKIRLVYTCANETSTDLSYNFVELRSVMGYMGEMEPATPLHLVIMLGFEYERAQQVIESYEPDYISIGYGNRDHSISSHLHDLNIKFKEHLVSMYTGNVIDQFEHSLVDPIETKKVLERIISLKPDCNTVIAPLNNKISTIGSGLLAIEHENIQVCYTQMGAYNTTGYSTPSDQCYLIDLY